MLHRKPTFYTLQEYFDLEETAEYKSEYYQGEIFAMAGGSANHNLIALNVATIFNLAFEQRPCRTFMSDMRLLVKAADLYTYPDIMIVCGQLKFAHKRTDIITNPVLIVEILSKSTESYDRGHKFKFYRTIPTLQHYILIDQAQIYLDYFQKITGGRWVLQAFSDPNQRVELAALDLELPLHRVYNKVTWDNAAIEP